MARHRNYRNYAYEDGRVITFSIVEAIYESTFAKLIKLFRTRVFEGGIDSKRTVLSKEIFVFGSLFLKEAPILRF